MRLSGNPKYPHAVINPEKPCEAHVILVKLIKLNLGLFGYDFAISNNVDKPGEETYFMVSIKRRLFIPLYWLVDDGGHIWSVKEYEVESQASSQKVPKINDNYYVVRRGPVSVFSDEHTLIMGAIRQFVMAQNE